ncbi:MAG: ABC transporter permease [Planctomycetaceae bacterium]|nr:ABC transporter permease [Planctomycetaceae bacterium]
MLRFIPYVLKTLWRHRTRTLLTVSGTAVAMFVFSFVGAVQEGLDRLLDDQQQDRSLIVFQANRFCPSTSKLPEDYALRISKLPGVKDAVPIKVFMNNCRASLDVVVFNGLPAEKLRSVRPIVLQEGDWSQFERQRDAALVGRAVAQRRKLSVGQKFSIGALTVTVAGIFQSPLPTEESMIYTHLEFLQRTRGLNSVGTATQMEVLLDESANAQATCKLIDDLYRAGPVGTNTRTKGAFQAKTVGDLVELVGFTRYLGLACVLMVLGLVATTTVMGVQDRIREHAVLQTIGFTGWHIFAFIIGESLVVSLIGGMLGTGTALAILQTSSLALGTEGILIAFLPSVSLAVMGLAASALVGLLAGIAPAWQAARAEIVPALRFA